MSQLPILNCDHVQQLIPSATNISELGYGGQKRVYAGEIEGIKYALKFALVPDELDIEELGTDEIDIDDDLLASNSVIARAKREVETMHDCDSPYMVKLGPIPLGIGKIDDQILIFYSEEFIDGKDLKKHLADSGPFSVEDVTRLGIHISDAINGLWKLQKVHRDVKPGNIMLCEERNEFILLDAGLAFDVVGESLSISPVGTPLYFSPEQFDFMSRRTLLDFRSDLFSLGVTLYEMLTGQHPFYTQGDQSYDLVTNIQNKPAIPPSQLIDGVPKDLEHVILRLLGKSPHLRFRDCKLLTKCLQKT